MTEGVPCYEMPFSRANHRPAALTGITILGMAEPDPSRSRVLRAESLGLILIVLLILAIVLLRWGGHIPWSAR
jgi:hypothetical protein